MTWGVNHLQDNFLPLVLTRARNPRQTHVLRLNGDTAFALNIHVVQILIAHIARCNNIRQLQNTVCQRRLTMVNVRDDAEVPDPGGIRQRRNGKIVSQKVPIPFPCT